MDTYTLHVDMDAFFASIEVRDDPQLAGKPVIIADLKPRSVVATCSYEARTYGIYSSMSAKHAYHLCPNGIFITPRISYYKTISQQIKEILLSITDNVEMFSLDEAYIDIRNNKINSTSAMDIATFIQDEIYKRLKLTVSIGISYNKFLAKMASDMKKPNGITVIREENLISILDPIDISKVYGIGKSTCNKLKDIGVRKVSDLRTLSKYSLHKLLGTRGLTIYNNIRGIDNSKIITSRQQKSLSTEETFNNDKTIAELECELSKKAHHLTKNLNVFNMSCRTISLHLRFSDFSQISKQMTLPFYTDNIDDITNTSRNLLHRCSYINKKIRLLGIEVSKLTIKKKEHQQQLCLF